MFERCTDIEEAHGIKHPVYRVPEVRGGSCAGCVFLTQSVAGNTNCQLDLSPDKYDPDAPGRSCREYGSIYVTESEREPAIVRAAARRVIGVGDD